MKQKSLLMALLVCAMGIPLQALADREVNQLQFGKQTITVASDETITFYDPWGAEDIVDQNSYNSQSLTVFQPEEAGKSVQITFETLDLNQYSASYYLYLNLYDGVADAGDTFQWATATSGVTSSSTLADLTGTLIAEKVNNDNKPALPAVYTSGTADGALSVAFMHRNSNECTGWVAKVKVVTLENQTITGAGSNYDGVVASPTSKQNVALANAYVTATGVMAPDPVTAISFSLTQNEGMVEPEALKLFRGTTQLNATVEAEGTGYRFVTNEAPVDGTTTFTIKGDLLGTAAVGAKVQVDVTRVATNGQPEGISPFTAATAVVVENPALVLMGSEPQTVTVGDTPLQFYDEGGADGGITANANGQVTFLPATEGKKVMVDFTKNEIWHGSYYNQELRIYNGQTVAADNLLKTLQQGETGRVRSTADDGALTVVLYSDASTTTAANGFEATVTQFEPQAMTATGAETAAASDATVCAGDKGQAFLAVNIKTQDTEPALTTSQFNFSTEGTFQYVTHATLYYTGATNTFAATQKVGEVDVTADEFAIATTPTALVEGDNYFWLCYDISDECVNDDEVEASFKSATFGNETSVAAASDAAIGRRMVENIVLSYANQGTVTKTVNGSIAFNTKNASSYSSYCEAGTDERINIFVPKHEGMVAQIDFSDFEVQYSSSSYGNKSVFKIYAGQGTSGTLLWELDSNDQEAVGPGQAIRSTSEDGALTIVFCPNTSYSYYYKGWKSTVSEYQAKEMALTGVEVAQASTSDASIGASNQELLTVDVKTEGNLAPLTMSGMKLDLKGTEAQLVKVSVWQGDTQVGQATADAAEVDVTFAEAVTLAEGSNVFTVKADVSGDATADATIDASLVCVHVGNADVTPENGDPEGERTLKNMVLMTEGDHGTLVLAEGKTVMVYDDGGADGDGADGVEATLTLAPAEEGQSVRLTNLGITFSYTAHLYIYEGAEANDDKLIVDLTGSSAKFDPIISDTENSDGCLTLKYVGKGSYTKPNFAIQAEGYRKSDVALTAITTEDISVSEVLKGQTDVKMLKVVVSAKGELQSLDITGFNVTGGDGEDVQAMHIYQTGNMTSFSANEEFNEKYTITNTGDYYFWITYDVTTTAAVGQQFSAQLVSIEAGGQTYEVAEPATASVTVASGKSGTYTVGGEEPVYATIQAAIDDLGTLGMEGPVVLDIRAGEYNEKVRIPYIKGMGAVNTLTLQSESGQRDVKIYHNEYTTSGYSDDQHKKDYGVVTLYEANHVTLKNLEVYTEDVSYKAVVMVKDESRHATIEGCYLHAPVTTTGDVCLVGHTIIDEENKNNDYLTVRNCLLEGGKMGISMGGTSYVALPKEVGGVIEGNTIKNSGTKAIYMMDELGAKVRNNTIIIESEADTKISVGILDMQLRDEYGEPTEITGNTFNVAPKTYAVAMNIRQVEATAEAPMLIANNVVNMVSLNASYSAFKLNGTKVKNLNIAHNTFRMTGADGGAAYWAASKLDDGYGNIKVVNNIIQNETSGYAVNLYNDGNLGVDKIDFQNNLIHTAGETFFRAASSTTGDFAAFAEKTGATNCLNRQAAFVSDDVLMPANTLDGDLLTAQALDYVTTDITGKQRPATGITIGAYEFDDADAVPVMAEGYPMFSGVTHEAANVLVKANAAGKAYVLVNTEAEADAQTVVAQGQAATLVADAETSVAITDLQPETNYYAHVVLESAKGTQGELATGMFSTAEAPVPELLVMITAPETREAELELGNSTTLEAYFSGGKAPFTAAWTTVKGEAVGEAANFDDTETAWATPVSATVAPTEPTQYVFTVTDARGVSASAKTTIVVTGMDFAVATLENLYLDEESSWSGDANDLDEYGTYTGGYYSGSFKFDTGSMPSYSYWYNFAYSNQTSTEYTSLADQFRNCVGHGADDSSIYGIAFPQGGKVTVLSGGDEGSIVPGFYITNTAYALSSMQNGDAYAKKFTEEDWFKVTVKGEDVNEEETGTVEFYLAKDGQFVTDWTYVDLAALGQVKYISFTMSSTDMGQWGMNTPGYFAFDNFGAKERYSRSVVDGDWGTLCLAKSVKADDIEGADVFTIVGKTATELVLQPVEGDLEAGVPYLFKATAGRLDCFMESGTAVPEATSSNGLVGTLTDSELPEGMFLVIADKVVKGGTGVTLAANNAYIDLDQVAEWQGEGTPAYTLPFDEATSISSLAVKNGQKDVFDLGGRKLNRAGKKGIYVKKGKKVVF